MKKGINNEGFKKLPQSVQLNIISNMKYGGRMYANGGNMLTEFTEGGTHEENPLGGIPQGQGPNGLNLVEEDETKFEDYIFSNQLKLDKNIAEEFDLPKKYIGKTFADISKLLTKPKSRREDDAIEIADNQRNLEKLRSAQETHKEKEVQAKLEEINALDPTAIPSLMQQGQGGPQGLEQEMMQQPTEQEMMMAQQQPSPEEMAMMEQMAMAQGAQPMMNYGGPLSKYAFGGYMNSYEEGGQMSLECPPHHHKNSLGECIPNWYLNIKPFVGIAAGAAQAGVLNATGAKNRRAEQEKMMNIMNSNPGVDPYTVGLGNNNSQENINPDGFYSENLDSGSMSQRPFATGGQMGCPPHHHKDSVGACIPNWYVGMMPELIGMGAAGIGGGILGNRTAKKQKEKDAAVMQMMQGTPGNSSTVDPTLDLNRFPSENMDNMNFPYQSYRTGGQCYGCGGKMYTTGGQLMAGIAGGAAGLAESLLPGQLGSMASSGIEALYNKMPKKGSKARQEQYGKIFDNAANTTGILGDIGESIVNPASIPGNIASTMGNVTELVSDNANLNPEQQAIMNTLGTGISMGSSLLGKYSPSLFSNTPINITEGVEDITNMVPTDFRYGGTMYANGGSMNDSDPTPKYLKRSEEIKGTDGTGRPTIYYRDTYNIGGFQYETIRQPGEPYLSEEELKNVYKEAKGKEFSPEAKKQDTSIYEKSDLEKKYDEERKQKANREAKLIADNTLNIDVEGTPFDPSYIEPPAGTTLDPNLVESYNPEESILSLSEAQKYNPGLEAWDPNAATPEEEAARRKMVYKQSPLSAFAGYAPMAYNLYQGLSPVDKTYTSEDFFTPVAADLVDYGESRKQASQFATGLMKEARNRGVNPMIFQSAYHAGLGNIRKIAEAEANENVKRLQENKKFNKQLETKAKLQAAELNIKGKTAKQDHIKEFIKGFYDNAKAEEANKLAAMYASMYNPNVDLEYQSYNPFVGIKNLFNRQ